MWLGIILSSDAFKSRKFSENLVNEMCDFSVYVNRTFLTIISRLKALVTYFINKSHPLPREIFVLPPKSSRPHVFRLLIALLSSCSSSIHVEDLDFLISRTCSKICESGIEGISARNLSPNRFEARFSIQQKFRGSKCNEMVYELDKSVMAMEIVDDWQRTSQDTTTSG